MRGQHPLSELCSILFTLRTEYLSKLDHHRSAIK
jgi:hypothetical protein